MRNVKNRKRWVSGGVLVLVGALIAAMVLTACAPSGNDKPPTWNPGPRPWRITVGLATSWENVNPLDPHGQTGAMFSTIAGCMFEGLVVWDHDEQALVGNLATRWEIDPDWKYVDFYIRDGVHFHDGSLMTAEDVKFSFERAMNPVISPYYIAGEWMRMHIDKVEIRDGNVVRVYCKRPFPEVLMSTYILPKNYIETYGDEYFAENPIGTGPFKLVDWSNNDWILFKTWGQHWRVNPNFDELMLKVVIEPATRFAMLKTRELDMTGILSSQIPEAQADPNLNVSIGQDLFLYAIEFFDMLKPNSIWSDARVRKAVSLAIDRKGIAESVMYGTYKPWGSYWASYTIGFREEVAQAYDPYDPEGAIRLLCEVADVDYPPGPRPYPWEEWAWGDFTWEPAIRTPSEAILANLHEVGIMVKAREMEQLTWSTKFITGDLSGIGYAPGPWWVGSVNPASSGYWSHIIGQWAPVGRQIPEFSKAFDAMLWAVDEEDVAQAAQAMEDLMFQFDYRKPVWSVGGAGAIGPRIAAFPAIPGQVVAWNLFDIVFRES